MNTKGIGLGLVIADQIVDKFDGKITFESIPGKGSNFTFTMKLFNANESAKLNNQNAPAKSQQDIKYQANQ